MTKPDSAATCSGIRDMATALRFSDRAFRRALQLGGLEPGATDWLRYIDRFLISIGALLIVAGIAAFFAWNWAGLGHMMKFAIIQGSFVGAALMAWRFGLDSMAGRASLFSTAFLVGILFAVFGQVYQTGADPYGLFLAWAVLVLPLAIIGRQAAIWILFQLLLNLALIMYWTQVVEPPEGWWQLSQLLGPLVWLSTTMLNATLATLVFILNITGLIAWELAHNRNVTWTQGRIYPRLIGLCAFCAVLIPTVIIIVGEGISEEFSLGIISPVLYAASSIAAGFYYQFRRPDLLMLTMLVFGAILVVMTFLARLTGDNEVGILMLAILLLAQLAVAAYWLRQVSRRWQDSS